MNLGPRNHSVAIMKSPVQVEPQAIRDTMTFYKLDWFRGIEGKRKHLCFNRKEVAGGLHQNDQSVECLQGTDSRTTG